MEATFKPDLKMIDDYSFSESEHDIESEPMIYGGSWNWCQENGGPITRQIMRRIADDFNAEIIRHALLGYHPVIDTKSVLLMPGQYPCIPGWHCDGVIRSERGGQPDIATIGEDIKHYICVIGENDGIVGTEVATNEVTLNIDPDNVWKEVDKQMGAYQEGRVLKSGQIAKINRQTLHRGSVATGRGWRYFFRLSFYHMPAMNRFRHQVQVYADINQGW